MLLDWFQKPLVLVWLTYFAALEFVSWGTSRVSPCIVNPNEYENDCPVFHVFLVKSMTSIFEKLGDPVWVTAIFTVVLGFATVFLWLATRNLVLNADRNAERQLRAYVLIGQEGNFSFADQLLTSMFPIRNYGATPAHEVHYAACLKILPYPLKESPFLKFPIVLEAGDKKSRSILGPSGQWIRGFGRLEGAFTREQVVAVLADRDNRLHCFGLIKYKDIFEIWHTTQFCYSISQLDGLGVASPNGVDIDYSPGENKAD